jgi:hypothetical protein
MYNKAARISILLVSEPIELCADIGQVHLMLI